MSTLPVEGCRKTTLTGSVCDKKGLCLGPFSDLLLPDLEGRIRLLLTTNLYVQGQRAPVQVS